MHPSIILILAFNPGETAFAIAAHARYAFGQGLSSIMQHIKRIHQIFG